MLTCGADAPQPKFDEGIVEELTLPKPAEVASGQRDGARSTFWRPSSDAERHPSVLTARQGRRRARTSPSRDPREADVAVARPDLGRCLIVERNVGRPVPRCARASCSELRAS